MVYIVWRSFLNEKGLRAHQDCKFQSNPINRILKSNLYCGYLFSGGSTSPLMKELKIVDENVFDSVQNIIKQRIVKNAEWTIPLNTKGKMMLSGNIFFVHCVSHLVVTRYKDRYMWKDGTKIQSRPAKIYSLS